MIPEDSPEWLPSGWTVKTNVLKTGRRTEYYLNSETGRKFFSKDDLIHHVRVQGLELGHSQPEKRKFESDSDNNHQIDVVRDIYECPDWLPHDWIMEVKTRKSGGEKGRIYKCFVELATGRKFYSKPEVIKYLRNVKRASTKLKEASIRSQRSSKVAFEKSTMDDLPPGWIKEVKITKSASKTRKDPYYTDPITGYVFRSRREVERYLETGEISRHAFLPKKRLLIDQDLVNSSSSTKREVINGLPARGQFLSGEHTGADKVSSDEINALSTPEASTQATGEILQAETVPRVTSTAEISSQNHSRDHANDNGGECEKSSGITVLAQPVPTGHLDGKADTDEGSGLTYESDIKHEQDSLKDGKERGFQQKARSSLSKSRNKKGINLPRRTSKRLAGVEPFDPVSSIVELDMAADPVSRIVEPDVVANPVSIVEALQDPTVACSNEGSAANVSADEPILNSEADIKQEDFDGNGLKDSSKVKAKNSSSKSAKRKMLNLPRRTSKRLAGLGPGSLPNSVSGAHAPQNVTSSSKDQAAVSAYSKLDDLPSEACQKHETEAAEQREKVSHYLQGEPSQTKQIHQQAVPSKQSEGLDTDKVTNKISVPKISPPFEEFLADPCLEFAYKTLTGAIPFEKAAHSMLFSNPANITNEKKSHVNSLEENSNRKGRTKSSKCKNRKESGPRWSSKQKTGFQLNPVSNSITNVASLYVATTKSGKSEAGRRSATVRENAVGVSQQVEVDTGMVRVHHGFPDIKTSHGWPVNKSKQPLDYFSFSGDHPLKPEQQPFFSLTGEQSQRPELQSSFLAGEFWSDPCLEFAFKTLTGSLPVEDNLLPPGYFQQQVNSYQPQRESYFQQPVETYPSQRDGNLALPDFGFPSFSQTDISAHFDSLEKQPVSQLQSSNSSVMPSGSVNLPSCGSIASPAPHIDGNTGIRGRVNS